MNRSSLLLLHSPLTSAAAWGALPGELTGRGRRVVAPDVDDDTEPPYAARYVASVARRAGTPTSVVLLAHSGAGALVGLVGAALREEGADVEAYVLLDAVLPPATDTTRFALLRAEDPAAAAEVEVLLHSGKRFPDYGETFADRALAATLRPRDMAFFEEPLPGVPGWPDAPATYLQLSSAYHAVADAARGRGLPVRRLLLGHFAAWEHPAVVADLLEEVLP